MNYIGTLKVSKNRLKVRKKICENYSGIAPIINKETWDNLVDWAKTGKIIKIEAINRTI